MTSRISIANRAARRNAWRTSGDDWSLWKVGTPAPQMAKFHRRKLHPQMHGGAHRSHQFSMLAVHRRLYAQARREAEIFNSRLAALAVNPPTVKVTAV